MQFKHFDIDGFLHDSWQQQPLLIRNPWALWENPLDPDELAGLACEEGVEARLISQTLDALKAEHGPFPQARFSQLGKAPWTLLVQAVDHYVPQVAALLDPFRFVLIAVGGWMNTAITRKLFHPHRGSPNFDRAL